MTCQRCPELTLVGVGGVFLKRPAIRTWSMWIVLSLKTNSSFQDVEQRLCIYSNIRSKCNIFRDTQLSGILMGRVRGRQAFHVRPAELSISVEASAHFGQPFRYRGCVWKDRQGSQQPCRLHFISKSSYAPGREGYLHAGPCFPEDLVLRGGGREERSRKNWPRLAEQ